eukprot:m.73180 g.73180  ORF g.73180 m.73180 type:complete len:121 (+) comp35827_c0_seq33:1365-1727(+)
MVNAWIAPQGIKQLCGKGHTFFMPLLKGLFKGKLSVFRLLRQEVNTESRYGIILTWFIRHFKGKTENRLYHYQLLTWTLTTCLTLQATAGLLCPSLSHLHGQKRLQKDMCQVKRQRVQNC